MYFPDEIEGKEKEKKKRNEQKRTQKRNWIKVAYNWCFEESPVRAFIIVLILMVLNFLFWYFI